MCMGVSGCDSSPERAPQALPTATVPASQAKAPEGWATRQGPGFQVSIPPEWQNRPEKQRSNRAAALEVGIPFTGQPAPPPLLLAFVEHGQVGPLNVREQVLRAQLTHALPDATIGTSTHAKVAGSTDALYFDMTYQTKGGTSVLGTPLRSTDIRQRELIIETPGLPKYGFRYSAPASDFNEDQWKLLVHSIIVRPGDGQDQQRTTA